MGQSVFYQIEEDPGQAANLTARANLMLSIHREIEARGWTQFQAARHLGTTQPRISALMNGKINDFSLDALVNMLPVVGLEVEVKRAGNWKDSLFKEEVAL